MWAERARNVRKSDRTANSSLPFCMEAVLSRYYTSSWLPGSFVRRADRVTGKIPKIPNREVSRQKSPSSVQPKRTKKTQLSNTSIGPRFFIPSCAYCDRVPTQNQVGMFVFSIFAIKQWVCVAGPQLLELPIWPWIRPTRSVV